MITSSWANVGKSIPAIGKSTGKAQRSGLLSFGVLFCWQDLTKESRQVVDAVPSTRGIPLGRESPSDQKTSRRAAYCRP